MRDLPSGGGRCRTFYRQAGASGSKFARPVLRPAVRTHQHHLDGIGPVARRFRPSKPFWEKAALDPPQERRAFIAREIGDGRDEHVAQWKSPAKQPDGQPAAPIRGNGAQTERAGTARRVRATWSRGEHFPLPRVSRARHRRLRDSDGSPTSGPVRLGCRKPCCVGSYANDEAAVRFQAIFDLPR